jgi:RNAse (barnase) inhibitor barstar
MSVFIFISQDEFRGAYRCEVPAGIACKTDLMEALFVALKFPDYFGGNWDALWECICDLAWLPEGDVVLFHNDLPLSADRALLSTYLRILKDAVEHWRAHGKRRLIVVFPSDTENIVQSMLGETEHRS